MDKALPSQLNEFIDQNQSTDLVQAIISSAQSKGAEQAEVGLQRSIGLTLVVRKGEVESIEFNRDQSVGITVYKNHRKGSASSSDLSREALEAAVDAALHLADFTEADPQAGLADINDMQTADIDCDLYHPWLFSMEEAIERAKACEASAYAYDKRIKNSDGATLSSNQGFHIYGNSHGFLKGYPSSFHSLNCIVIAEDNQGMERDYQYTLSRDPKFLEKGEKIGQEAAQRTLRKLNAQKLPTQTVPVLLEAPIASGFLSHFMSAISGGRLFRQSSFLCDTLGQALFPEHITLMEKPHLLGGIGSAPYDADGVATFEKAIVESGVLKHYLLDAYSARKLKMPNTGNAGGAHNVMVSHGSDTFEQLVKKLDRGLLVTSLMGQGINLVTGDYSRGATGFWVENGVIQYPVHEITIAGNLRSLYQNILAIGNDVDQRSNIKTGSILLDNMMVAGI